MSKFSPQKYPALVTALALIAAFTLVFLYEKSVIRLIGYYQVEFVFPPWGLILVSSLVPLLLLLLICALAWLGLRYLPLSRFSAALWILSGLIIIALRLNMWFLIQFFPNGITFPIWLRTPGLFGRIRHYFMDFGAIGYESSI